MALDSIKNGKTAELVAPIIDKVKPVWDCFTNFKKKSPGLVFF